MSIETSIKYFMFNKSALLVGLSILITQHAFAGGFDRSNHPYDDLFNEGTTMSAQYINVNPERSGRAWLRFNENPTEQDYTYFDGHLEGYDYAHVNFKMDLNQHLSCLLQYDNSALGVNSDYQDKIDLGPGKTDINMTESSVLCSVSPNGDLKNGFKIIGGLTERKVDAFFSQKTSQPLAVALPILGDVPLGLSGDLYGGGESNKAIARVFGFSWEKASTQTRISAMFWDSTEHIVNGSMFNPLAGFTAADGFSLDGATVPIQAKIEVPKAYVLDVQSGLSAKYNIGGGFGVQHTEWGKLKQLSIEHDSFFPLALNLNLFQEDVTQYYVGFGKKFTDNFSAGMKYIWEDASNPVSNRGTVDAKGTIGVGARISVGDFEFTPRVAYTKLAASSHTGLLYKGDYPKSVSKTWGVGVKYKFK